MDTPMQTPASAAEEQKPDVQADDSKPVASVNPNLIDKLYFGTAEKTVQESPYYPESFDKPYNPDDIYKKTGNYSLYEDMMHDDQVSVCMTIKKDMVIGSGWELYSSSEKDDQQEVIQDLECRLKDDMEVALNEALEEILTAYEYGFSLTEKIFEHRPDGTLSLKALKTRHPSTWRIHTDVKGAVSKYEQLGRNGDLDINPLSLIHYVNNRKFQNPYGKSDLRSAYNAWFVKRQVIRYYGIFLEKAASPVPVASYDVNTPPKAIDDIYEAIKKLQTKTALVVPKAMKLEFLEAKTNGEAYRAAIDIFNMFIGRALIIPDLLGFQGGATAGGAFALGKKQLEVLFKHIQKRRQTLERFVNRDLIMPMCVWNYGLLESYPAFRFKPIDDEVIIELAKLWCELIKGKTYKPSEQEINHFRNLTKFPEGPVEFHEPIQMPGAADPAEGEDQSDPTNPDPSAGNQPSKNPEQDKKKEFKLYALPPGSYHRKCDFKVLKSHLDSYKNAVMTEAYPVVKKIFQDLYDQIENKKILASGKTERIESLKLKYLKDLKTILKTNLRSAYVDSKHIAQKEILKGTGYAKPTADEAFMEALETNTYQYIGDWEYAVSKKARIIIMEAIADGKPLSAVFDALEAEGLADSMTSLERYARTKFTEVTNEARLNFFKESDVVAAYQYSAILDDRTTDICAGLDGKIFAAGTEPCPPMHFNCRSLLVPITKYEEWEADAKVGKTPIDKFIEDNKGDGFSRS